LINETQHGLVKMMSVLTSLLEFLEFASNYADEGFPIEVDYLDFQKAFN
jgi:hypothetical protein